jgi:Cell division protein FtsI/penicillin-binding protein 2
VPYGVLAAVNPETGAVLGFASYAHNKKKSAEISPLIAYPPGSIAKIITATAAIESKGFYPGFNICLTARFTEPIKQTGSKIIGTGSNDISFKEAFAKSCDVAFGKIAGILCRKKTAVPIFR